MQYRLRTLLIVLAIGPPVLAWMYDRWERHRNLQEIGRQIVEAQMHLDEVRNWMNGGPPPRGNNLAR